MCNMKNVSTSFVAEYFNVSRRTIARAAKRAKLERMVGKSLVFLWPQDREVLSKFVIGRVGNPNFGAKKKEAH
jgi:hypothetical protein